MAKQPMTPEGKKAAQNADTFLLEVLTYYIENGGPKASAQSRGKTDNDTILRMKGLAHALESITRRRMESRTLGRVKAQNVFANI